MARIDSTSDVSPDVRRLNPHVFGGSVQRSENRAANGPTVGNEPEANLQAACESVLDRFGYLRLTATNAEKAGAPYVRGFYGHLPRAIGNPLMPDLFVLHVRRPALLVELKTRMKYQPGQREMIDSGWWREVRSEEEFRAVLVEWEGLE